MRHELRSLFTHYLSRERLRAQGIFDPEAVNGLLEAHLSGKALKTNQLWGLFVFQLWYERMGKRLTHA